MQSFSLIIYQEKYLGEKKFAIVSNIQISKQQRLLLKVANQDPSTSIQLDKNHNWVDVEFPLENIIITNIYDVGIIIRGRYV